MKQSSDALSDIRHAASIRCTSYQDYYNLAIAFVIGERYSEAFQNLKVAFEQESIAKQYAIHDDLFDPVRDHEEFKRLIR